MLFDFLCKTSLTVTRFLDQFYAILFYNLIVNFQIKLTIRLIGLTKEKM